MWGVKQSALGLKIRGMDRLSPSIGILIAALLCLATGCVAQESPSQPAVKVTPLEGDYVSRDFHFKSGETLPELRLHYLTLGKPERDANGKVTNAVLLLHGTGAAGRSSLAPQFAAVCSGRAKLTAGSRYFVI